MNRDKYLTIPIRLLNELNPTQAIILSYIRYRCKLAVNFVEANDKIAKKLGIGKNTVTRAIKKLKEGGYLNYFVCWHDEIVVGLKNNLESQITLENVYLRKLWITKKGESYYVEQKTNKRRDSS